METKFHPFSSSETFLIKTSSNNQRRIPAATFFDLSIPAAEAMFFDLSIPVAGCVNEREAVSV